MRLKISAFEFRLSRFERRPSAAAEFRHMLDKIAQLWPLLPPSTSILPLSASASSLAARATTTHLAGLLVLRFSL